MQKFWNIDPLWAVTHFKQCVELLQLINAESCLCHYGPHLEKGQEDKNEWESNFIYSLNFLTSIVRIMQFMQFS